MTTSGSRFSTSTSSNIIALWLMAQVGWFCALSFSKTAAAQTFTLAESLAQAVQNAPELKSEQAQLNAAMAAARGADAAHDWHYFLEGRYESDKSEAVSSFSGDRRENRFATTGVQKYWGTGTLTKLGYEWGAQATDFPAPPPPLLLPTGDALSLNDPEANLRYNPANQQSIYLELRQNLWRGLFARDVKIKRAIGEAAETPPLLRARLSAQIIQGQVEQVFWNLVKLESQMNLTRRLIEKSKLFAKLMRGRVNIGRADQVDVASAEAAVIAQEGKLLQLELTADELRKKLALRINPNAPTLDLRLKGSLQQAPYQPPPLDLDKALAIAEATRFDLQLIEAQAEPLRLQLDLAREEKKPDFDLFVRGAATGLDSKADESFDKVKEAKDTKISVGLSLTWNLQNTAPNAARAETLARITALDFEKATIRRDAKEAIASAITAHNSAGKLRAQAMRHIESLKKQERAERRKFLQARSEEIGALRFEIEALSAEEMLIDARFKEREAEARLRLAVHGYEKRGL